jgi:hypothetical protein
MGPYALAFISIVLAYHELAKQLKYDGMVGYVVDKGQKRHSEQLNGAHSAIIAWEQKGSRQSHTGPIVLDYDHRVNALQAADVVAWSYHRDLEASEFGDEFMPLKEKLLAHDRHSSIPIPKEGIKLFADAINSWLGEGGEMPTLEEMMRGERRQTA